MATSSKRGKRSQVSDIQKCSSEVLFNPDQNFPLSWSFPDQCKTLNWAQRGNSQFFPLLLNFIAGNIKCSAALCSYFGGKSMQLSCMAINYVIKNNLTVNFWIYLWQTVMGCVGRMGSDTVTEVWRRVNTWHTKLERHRLSSYYHSLSLQWAWLCPQWCSGWFAGFLICSVVPSMMTLFCFSFYLFFSAGRICWVFFFKPDLFAGLLHNAASTQEEDRRWWHETKMGRSPVRRRWLQKVCEVLPFTVLLMQQSELLRPSYHPKCGDTCCVLGMGIMQLEVPSYIFFNRKKTGFSLIVDPAICKWTFFLMHQLIEVSVI